VGRRRRQTRREQPSRLDERLISIDLDVADLERELQQLLETRALAPEASAGSMADDPARDRVSRPQSVPEAEVFIIRREGVAALQQARQTAAEAPPAPIQSEEPSSSPRPAFNGAVEEASVVIIRRTPREPTP
jgi:hypothetical protein